MKPLTALLLVLALAGCTAPAAAPSASATVAVASPTPTPPSTTAAPTPSVAPTATPTLIPLPNSAQLSAPTGTVIWALVAATRLFRSTDRGDTWQERPLPAQPINPLISFIDDHEGWLATPAAPATQCQSQTVALSHTADAGTTWSSITVTGIAPAQCKEALSFPDAQHGFLSAWDPNSPPLIYRTTDGGRTWTASQPLPNPPGFTTTTGANLRAGQVKAFGQALLVEVVGQTASAQRRYVFISGDGGATWSRAADAPDPDSTVVFVTGSRWFQLSAGAVPKETTDSGATWHAFTTDYQQAAPVAPSIVFGDEQVGYATVRGSIQRTIDGGAHWTPLRTPGTF
jgi:photosystem II stability/assembly factor-like uncharacterized protein